MKEDASPSIGTSPNTIVTIGVLTLIILNIFPLSTADIFQRILGNLIIVVGTIPLYIYFLRRDNRIPVLPVFAPMFGILYGLPILIREFHMTSPLDPVHALMYADPYVNKALLLCLVGLSAVYVGYYMFPGVIIGKFMPRPRLELDPKKARLTAIILASTGVLFYSAVATTRPHFIVPVKFTAFFDLFGGVFLTGGITILYILYKQNKLKRLEKIFLFAAFTLSVLAGFLSGASATPVKFILPFILLYLHCEKRIPWLPLGIILTVVAVVYSAQVKFPIHSRRTAEVGLTERISLYTNALQEGATDPRKSLGIFSQRLNMLNVLVVATEATPEYVPYWGGYTLLRPILWMPVPRFIYPDKPQWRFGYEFGHRYGKLSITDRRTTFNLPGIVELYINFGTVGVVIGMTLLGTIFRTIVELANHEKSGGMLVIAIFILGRLLLTTVNNISAGIAGVFWPAIVLFVIIKLFACRMPKRVRIWRP